MKKKYVILLLAILIAGCEQSSSEWGIVTLKISSIGNTTIEKFNVTSTTALSLLKYRHKVETTYGNYVKCIDDVCANKEYVWTFYVDGEKSTIGASQYIVKNGDEIEFRFNKGG